MKKLLGISSILMIVVGVMLAVGGAWGLYFTYKNIAQEHIVTPADASIPEKAVRGPFTLKAQADIIRAHTLRMTEGKTFAEMPRQIPQLGQDGKPVLNAEGKPVMVPNTARDIWITAMTLIIALYSGMLAYAFFGFVLLWGLIVIWIGGIFCALSRVRHNEIKN